ncbi:MAG TPA: hypothetical protein VJ883_07205 [Woeseiaceae bacterium]|nr:hypothetical protein [Woeseiaceae bacterium]
MDGFVAGLLEAGAGTDSVVVALLFDASVRALLLWDSWRIGP